MAAPIRILEVVNVMDRAGLETFLMNHYRHIDRDVVQMDFLTHRPVAGAYDDEIRSLGGRIYRAPRLYPQNWLRYHKWMNSFFAEHDYRVVHSHIDAMSYFPLTVTRLTGTSSTRSKKSAGESCRASLPTTGHAAKPRGPFSLESGTGTGSTL